MLGVGFLQGNCSFFLGTFSTWQTHVYVLSLGQDVVPNSKILILHFWFCMGIPRISEWVIGRLRDVERPDLPAYAIAQGFTKFMSSFDEILAQNWLASGKAFTSIRCIAPTNPATNGYGHVPPDQQLSLPAVQVLCCPIPTARITRQNVLSKEMFVPRNMWS